MDLRERLATGLIVHMAKGEIELTALRYRKSFIESNKSLGESLSQQETFSFHIFSRN